jgi:hypothetical protein
MGFVCYEIRKWGTITLATATQAGVTQESLTQSSAPALNAAQQSFVRSKSVVARVVAGETLIVPIRAKVGDLASIYSFNGTGTLIWKLLDSPRTAAELAMAVAEEYEVDLAQAERDVSEFVNEMKAVGLVEVPAVEAMAGD